MSKFFSFILNFIYFWEISRNNLTHIKKKIREGGGEWWWWNKRQPSVIHLVCSTLLMYVVTRWIAAMKYWRRNLHFLLSLMPKLYFMLYFDMISHAQRVWNICTYILSVSVCLEKKIREFTVSWESDEFFFSHQKNINVKLKVLLLI